MSATADQELAQLRRAYEEMRSERDTALSELQTRTAALGRRDSEYGERIQHQSATIDVLKAMSASPGDPQPIFELITRRAQELCNAVTAGLFEYDGTMVHISSAIGGADPSTVAKYAAAFPMAPARGSITCRAILDRKMVHISDMDAEPELLQVVRDLDIKSNIALPLMHNGSVIGAIALNSNKSGGFTENQVELLETFAEQAVIAISSAAKYRTLQERTQALGRRNSEYEERIEQQNATIDVLKAMSASPGDAHPVFKLIVDRARAFCEADHATTALLRDGMLHLQAFSGMSADYVREYVSRFPRPVDLSTMFGRAILARETVQAPYVQADPALFASQIASFADFHTVVGVPMLRGGEPIGAIALGRRAPGGFTETQIELLKTFAEQAVIAIGSAESYRALHEALEQQTATSEVLQVINASPGNLAPVFDAILEKAHTLCGAAMGSLVLFYGTHFRAAATLGYPEEYDAVVRQAQLPTIRTQALIRGECFAHVLGMQKVESELDHSVIARSRLSSTGIRTALWMPLRRDSKFLGFISAYRRKVQAFSETEIDPP